MPKIHVTYEFEDEEEMREHFALETRAVSATARSDADDNDADDAGGDGPTRDDVDSDGMPYDATVHSDPPSFKADGTWRAQRGKAKEADAARAAWKARGGDVVAPTPALPDATPALPDATPALPDATRAELPGAAALPAEMPAPVSFDALVAEITARLGGGMTQDQLKDLYAKHGGTDPVATLSTNETARAAMMADLKAS